ncbi:hypothetical protein [Amycolatopsis speibonae]|uniref:Uncharacterized protein n=1 Tax=Amycolatopsis speibonae TaxID=1450224 RepID=A0ABV7P473_9PSEU
MKGPISNGGSRAFRVLCPARAVVLSGDAGEVLYRQVREGTEKDNEQARAVRVKDAERRLRPPD